MGYKKAAIELYARCPSIQKLTTLWGRGGGTVEGESSDVKLAFTGKRLPIYQSLSEEKGVDNRRFSAE